MENLYYNIINSENDKSKYIWNIIKSQKRLINNNNIPKVIMQYWDSCNSIPDDVLECMETWKKFANNEIKYMLYNKDNALEEMINTKEAYNDKFMERRIYYVNNNPLIAPPNNPIIKRALETATENLLKKLDRDFQSISGPGNLVNSIIWFYIKHKNFYNNIQILTDWDEKVVSKWPLDYRKDTRNWRNFKINME